MRTSRWDRPPPPRDWRWVVGGVGKVLIATGLLMFGFVAYQLWGTGLEYSQAQNRLEDDFAELIAGLGTITDDPTTVTTVPTTTETTVATPSTDVAPTTTAAPAPAVTVPDFSAGDVMAFLEIPSIGVETYVVSGVAPNDLKKGPGHYPDTPQPGQLGNSAIAGHRTTYGQPFYSLEDVEVGDEIVVTTVQGRFVYRATGSEVVRPSQSDVIATTDPAVARLTLTTCDPRYTATNRLIVYAELDVEASNAPPQQPIVDTSRPTETLPGQPTSTAPASAATTPTATTPDTTATSSAPDDSDPTVSGDVADAFAHGWFSDDAAWPQVALWGLVLTVISLGAWLLSRQVRRNWVGALAGIIPFLVALYFFYQNVNRLLPAAL